MSGQTEHEKAELEAIADKLAQLAKLGHELQKTGTAELRHAERRRAELAALKKLAVSGEHREA